jgi:acyl-CoA thioesterase FadM
MKYHRPALPEKPLALGAWITEQGGESEPMMIHAEARDAGGRLVAAGEFKVIPLSAEKFKQVAGVAELPEHWRSLLRTTG